jgi:hypothetical protein
MARPRKRRCSSSRPREPALQFVATSPTAAGVSTSRTEGHLANRRCSSYLANRRFVRLDLATRGCSAPPRERRPRQPTLPLVSTCGRRDLATPGDQRNGATSRTSAVVRRDLAVRLDLANRRCRSSRPATDATSGHLANRRCSSSRPRQPTLQLVSASAGATARHFATSVTARPRERRCSSSRPREPALSFVANPRTTPWSRPREPKGTSRTTLQFVATSRTTLVSTCGRRDLAKGRGAARDTHQRFASTSSQPSAHVGIRSAPRHRAIG